ncbi:hypothetical protein M422DRAFT_61991 [Sphaerobolus stellatus SS14]|uniref:RNA helicase n=1 Tax=Sphaerobolus stellatus (strain SS14) TaxID=990650 RepID=A0A0C9URA8_SPHS4|nr:hypothetical protein M422DRAFT_61991 [Sphaerobolus stellatus SS14]
MLGNDNRSKHALTKTNQILRSMLYRGSEIMREVAWVIFDEIQYMRDAVRRVFLSATIPNATQLAEWIYRLHDQPCHVVYTDFRPTPLQHYLFPMGDKGIHLVVNEKGEFREDNFQKAVGMVAKQQGEDPAGINAGKGKKGKTKKGGQKGTSDISKIVDIIVRKNYDPVNNTDEQAAVEKIFQSATMNLSEENRALPPISRLFPILKRGIGIHHGGLLPILKEVVEILFQESLLKVLFATETFSIGLNMPAKTVVFTNVWKFDGKELRNLSSGEYIQMAGRAGHRGLDERGVVIMMCDEKLEPTEAKRMIMGQADQLDSAFHLGYNMVLNLMKKEEEHLANLAIEDEEDIAGYYDLRKKLDELTVDFTNIITHPSYCWHYLEPGRLVRVKHETLDFGWGIVVNRVSPKQPQTQLILDVLLNCAAGSVLPAVKDGLTTAILGGITPCLPTQEGVPLVVRVLLTAIERFSIIRLYLPKDLRTIPARETAWKSVLECQKRFPEGIMLLDPIAHMKIEDEQFKVLVETRPHANPLHNTIKLAVPYDLYSAKEDCRAWIRNLKKRLQATHDSLQLEELKCRNRVLRRLGFTTAADIVDINERVICEVTTGDELLLTELIFSGVFNPLLPEQCAALLSCFVFTEKNEKTVHLREELAGPLRTMQEVARRIAKVANESKLLVDEDDYVSSFNVELMDTVLQWCRGASFFEIIKLTEQFEGNLVRVFRRLQELIRQISKAATVIGNLELEEKLKKASEMLERPNSVIFCSSLYLG